MNEMLERAAAALAPMLDPVPFAKMPKTRRELRIRQRTDSRIDFCQDDVLAIARAVIEAIREPTPEMINAGHAALANLGQETDAELAVAHRAAIDAILGDDS